VILAKHQPITKAAVKQTWCILSDQSLRMVGVFLPGEVGRGGMYLRLPSWAVCGFAADGATWRSE
jgi:RES domain-containing protein